MKILMLHLQGSAVGYYRHILPARALRERGHEVVCFDDEDNFIAGIGGDDKQVERWMMHHMETADVVHIGYAAHEGVIKLVCSAREYAARALGRNVPLITDVDDDIFNVPKYNASYMAYHGGGTERRLSRFHLQVSDAVTVSTEPLAEVVKSHAKYVYHLPNCARILDWDHFQPDPTRVNDHSVRLMFTGGRGRIGDIDTLQHPLERLMETYNGDASPLLRLLFIGAPPSWSAQWLTSSSDTSANRAYIIQVCPLEYYWSAVRWSSPDILVNPVVTNTFNKSKSHIKAYDAVLGNAAYVGTDWPTHDQVPSDVMYKCATPVQWVETLSYLIENAEARRASASRLRRWAIDACSIEKYIDRWETAYEECARRPVVRSLEDTALGGV